MTRYAALDRLHARVVRVHWLQYFTAFTRVLLAISFLPSGMTKVLNHRFTSLPISEPVGFFFEAFYRSGVWYQFVGWAQLTAAVLLLLPRTATLGALLYFTIIVNIALVTIGVGFTGTPVLTVLMALAALYLVCWEYDKWRFLLPSWDQRTTPAPFGPRVYVLSALGWATAGAAAFGAAYALHLGNVDRSLGARGFLLLAALGAAFGLVTAWHARGLEVPTSPRPSTSQTISGAQGSVSGA
jgi:uncharacterized membrane protein YphA (DoxX/SURF4 family)